MTPQDDMTLHQESTGEEGSALVIALLAVVMMTILGMVLLDVLRGGAVQAVSTEAGIQAEAIAQKGLDDTVAQIRRAVAIGESLGDGITGNGKTKYRNRMTQVEQQLSSILPYLDRHVGTSESDWNDENGEVVNANRGSYRIDLLAYPAINPEALGKPVTYPDYPYVRKFDIRSRGTIDGNPGKVVTKQMTVYVSTINPVFRYPVSSGGDLLLNGTPYVLGDILVRGSSLQVKDEALFIGSSGTRFGIETGLPALRGFIRVVGDGDPLIGTKRYNKTSVNTGTESSELPLPAFFTEQYFPLEDPTLDVDTEIDVDNYVLDKLDAAKLQARLDTGFGEQNVDLPDPELYNTTKTKSILYDNMWVTYQGQVTVNPSAGEPNGDVFVNNGTLTLYDPTAREDDNPYLTLKRGSLYVRSQDRNLVAADLRGTLEIDDDRFVAVKGNVTLNNGFKFPRGTMYIDGDLKIIGDITLQGTVYVKGNVELKEMTSINREAGQTNLIPLIVVASGEIVLGNNSNANDDQVRAFLYSQKGLKLYGVISKLNLLGGVHGETGVELNAVRGELTGGGTITEYSGRWTGPVPEGQSNLSYDKARLQILYDKKLFDQPPAGIPTTQQFHVFGKDVLYLR